MDMRLLESSIVPEADVLTPHNILQVRNRLTYVENIDVNCKTLRLQ